MKFEENLRELRKQNGLSQEELAEQLNVSRQAVSKWENGSGYPELDKLMALCELFHCTMDDLLKGDVTERNVVGIERYEQHCNQMSRAVTFGVFMCISAVTAGAFMETLFTGRQESILMMVFFILVTIGVLTFVYYGIQSETFHRKYPEVPQNIYTESELDAFNKKFQLAMVIGVGMILISLVIHEVIDQFAPEYIANGVFMAIVSIAVSLFVYFGLQKTKYEDTRKAKQKPVSQEEKQIGKYSGVIMMIATIIFLLWGFLLDGWYISWLVFPIGGILCGIVSVLLSKDH